MEIEIDTNTANISSPLLNCVFYFAYFIVFAKFHTYIYGCVCMYMCFTVSYHLLNICLSTGEAICNPSHDPNLGLKALDEMGRLLKKDPEIHGFTPRHKPAQLFDSRARLLLEPVLLCDRPSTHLPRCLLLHP